MVIVDRASLLLTQALSGLCKVQEQCWRLLELHSIKIVSSGIIWVSLQEVGIKVTSLPLNDFVGLGNMRTLLIALFSFNHHFNILYICGGGSFKCFSPHEKTFESLRETTLFSTIRAFLGSKSVVVIIISTGFSDELGFPGAMGICATIPTVTTYGIQHLCCVGLHHGGVQDALPAQSHQTPQLLLQLHSCEYTW